MVDKNDSTHAAHQAIGAVQPASTEPPKPDPELATEVAPTDSEGSLDGALAALRTLTVEIMALAVKAEEVAKQIEFMASYAAEAAALRDRYHAALAMVHDAIGDGENVGVYE